MIIIKCSQAVFLSYLRDANTALDSCDRSENISVQFFFVPVNMKYAALFTSHPCFLSYIRFVAITLNHLHFSGTFCRPTPTKQVSSTRQWFLNPLFTAMCRAVGLSSPSVMLCNRFVLPGTFLYSRSNVPAMTNRNIEQAGTLVSCIR